METIGNESMHCELKKYQPRFMVLLGRHAEPSSHSIYDQINNVKIRSDNFEESSLTLNGIYEASMFSVDLLNSIFQKMPEGKINIILAGTKAYRTQETAQIIKEELEKQAIQLGREVEITLEPVVEDNLLGEDIDEVSVKSKADIDQIVSEAEHLATMRNENVVFIGVTHEAKLNNYLKKVGFSPEVVNTGEFLSIVDSGNGKEKVSFRNNTIEKSF